MKYSACMLVYVVPPMQGICRGYDDGTTTICIMKSLVAMKYFSVRKILAVDSII